MGEDEGRGRRRIESVDHAFRAMAEDLQAGDSAAAIVIGDHLVAVDAAHGPAVRQLYESALAGGLDHGALRQRLWTMDRARGLHDGYFSAAGQDRYLAEALFRGRTDGVFVDIGAYDGVTGSNTLYFERLGWQGLCVEASPTQFRRLAGARVTECVHAALADVEGDAAFLEITEGFDQMSGLKRSLRSGFADELKLMSKTTPTSSRDITVPVTTLTALARARGFERIDYCSIDVEGAELSVLRGIDYQTTRVGAFSIENPPGQADTHAAVREFLGSRGYRRLTTLGSDDIFAEDG